MISRIGCFSYVPLGYGTPQVRYLLQSLAEHYQLRQPPGVLAPRWSTYKDLDASFSRFFVHRLPPTAFRVANLQEYIERLISYCSQASLGRIAFYGAGAHTRDLLRLWQESSGPPISTLLVSNPPAEREFMGVPVVSVAELDRRSIDLVVLSSCNFEAEMAKTLSKQHPDMPFAALYNPNLSRFRGFPSLKRESLLDLERYASWIDAYEPDLLLCTHYTYLDALCKSRHKPRFVIYYCLEMPGGTDGSPFSDNDFIVHRRVKSLLSLALFPEKNRMGRYQETFDFASVPSAVLYNSRPQACSAPLPWDRRNGKILLQGSLVEGRTFIEYLPRQRRSDIFIDVYGQAYEHAATLEILNDHRRGRAAHYRYFGFLSNEKLSAIRSAYAYSLVMWNPVTFDALHACPNKFFESIADGVPPICAPHPQCKEIIERFNCGILMKDWSFESFAEALCLAEALYGTARYRQLVANCRKAQREIAWERQFDSIKPQLPATAKIKPARRPKFLIIDPTLQSEVGHHLVYASNVLQPARKAGFETLLGLNRNFLVKVEGADRLFPIFWHDFWGRDTSLPERPTIPGSGAQFVAGVENMFRREKLSGKDHVFIPNISDLDLESLTKWIARSVGASRCTWHFVLRHDLPPDPARRIRAMGRLQRLLGVKARFYTDTAELTVQHGRASGVPVRTLPIPVTTENTETGRTVPAFSVPLRVTYVGDARWEKGFCELPGLIESCKDLLKRDLVRFRIQCNTPGPEFECELAIKKLRKLAKRLPIDLVTTRLSKEAYDAQVRNADVILALYDRKSYQRRSSHVFMEALIYRKAVIVTRGTSPGNLLPPGCAWLCDEPSKAARPLRWIVNNPGAAHQIAVRLQKEHADFHTGSRLLDALLGD